MARRRGALAPSAGEGIRVTARRASRPADDGPRTVRLVTPEGIPLDLTVAELGTRIAALAIDLLIILVVMVPVILASIWLGLMGAGEMGSTLLALALFFVRTFYFAWSEIRGGGATPGKRRMGIRAVDFRGGPLTTDALFARNLTRELEIFLPVWAALAAESFWPSAPTVLRLGSLAWVVALLCVPLLDPQRRRLGDLVGGTILIEIPPLALEREVRGVGETQFSEAMLGHYGIYELETLEEILRRPKSDRRLINDVAGRIKKRIDWPIGPRDPQPDNAVFLRDFYSAQRAHLENKVLFGVRKEDKHDPADGARG